MFTGLIEALGAVREVRTEEQGRRLVIAEAGLARELELGESVAVNGCCLTAIEIAGEVFAFQAGPETLSKTNLGELRPGDAVNLERALRVGDRLGGHWVQGHVDGVGTLAAIEPVGEWLTMWFACPAALARQMVAKGSIAVDGISLTLVEVTENRFSVALIPHTLDVTSLSSKRLGDHVNLETDILAKYVQRLLTPDS